MKSCANCKQQDYLTLYRDEAAAHKVTKVLRDMFFIAALIFAMFSAFLLWYLSGFTTVEPAEVTRTEQRVDGDSIGVFNNGNDNEVTVYGSGSSENNG